jgi:hypothetical protein
MLTRMTEKDWTFALEVFDAAQSSRGEPGRDDRKFLEAILYFMVHNVGVPCRQSSATGTASGSDFWRLSRTGVFETFFQLLAEPSRTAHLVQFFDSTVVRARGDGRRGKSDCLVCQASFRRLLIRHGPRRLKAGAMRHRLRRLRP